MKVLTCKILHNEWPDGFSSPNYYYEVYDGDEMVAGGVSSSPAFVKKDAGGYHTKAKFDELYPEGWVVEFDFDKQSS